MTLDVPDELSLVFNPTYLKAMHLKPGRLVLLFSPKRSCSGCTWTFVWSLLHCGNQQLQRWVARPLFPRFTYLSSWQPRLNSEFHCGT
eukprot:1532214-Amphidinium_carterae.1